MRAIARRFKIATYKTTAYRPQSNGSVERAHHVLWEYLKQVVNNKADWDEYLELANLSYNTSVHEGTGYTPHELVFGKTARVPTSEQFLLPRSRILTTTGTPRDCNGLLPTMYRIDSVWYRMTPRPVEALAPPIIEPLTQPKWQYSSPNSLATSGIYSSEDLDRLRTHIMFPVEKPSMLNNIAQGAMGGKVRPGTISMINLLDEASIDRIAESAGAKMWKGFMSFGSASAGVFAIFLIARIIKLGVDTMIHGYALHSIYGWSIHLLGAIWTSVTNLLLHLGGRRQQQNKQQDIEKGETPSTTEDLQPGPSTQPLNVETTVRSAPNASTTQYTYHALRQYLKDSEVSESKV